MKNRSRANRVQRHQMYSVRFLTKEDVIAAAISTNGDSACFTVFAICYSQQALGPTSTQTYPQCAYTFHLLGFSYLYGSGHADQPICHLWVQSPIVKISLLVKCSLASCTPKCIKAKKMVSFDLEGDNLALKNKKNVL